MLLLVFEREQQASGKNICLIEFNVNSARESFKLKNHKAWGSIKLFFCRLGFSILQKIPQNFLFSAKDKSLLHYSFIIFSICMWIVQYLNPFFVWVLRRGPTVLRVVESRSFRRPAGVVLGWGHDLVGMDFPSFHTQRLGAVKVWERKIGAGEPLKCHFTI